MKSLHALALVIILALAVGLGGFAVAAEQKPDTYKGLQTVIVIIDGEQLVCDVPAVIIDGRTMVPLRAIMEALGSGVTWDAASQTVEVATEGAAPTAKTGTTEGADGATGTGGATTAATPEQIAAAQAAYDAAVAAAEAAREVANDALYHQYSYDPSTGAFDSEVYNSLYLPALALVEADSETDSDVDTLSLRLGL